MGSFHEQVSVVSHEVFDLLNGGTGGGWIPVPASNPGSSVFSSGTSSQLPPFIPLTSKSPCSASPSTSKSQTDSQLVCYACLDYSLRAGRDDFMDLIRGFCLSAASLLSLGSPCSPALCVVGLGWGPGIFRSLQGFVSPVNSCCFAALGLVAGEHHPAMPHHPTPSHTDPGSPLHFWGPP